MFEILTLKVRRARDEAVAAAAKAADQLEEAKEQQVLLLETLAVGRLDAVERKEKQRQAAGLEKKLERLQEELAASIEKRDAAQDTWKLVEALRDSGRLDVATDTLASLEVKLDLERLFQGMAAMKLEKRAKN